MKVIVDTDVGWDDVLSILSLIKNPNVEIVGITVTGCGETHLPDGVSIAQALLELGSVNAPVSAGAETPSLYDNQFPASFRAQMDDVLGLRSKFPAVTTKPDPRPAWEFIRDQLNSSREPITIISLGGLTNLARLLEQYPDSNWSNLQQIVIMGGAVFCDGNVALLNNATPEWDQGPAYSTNTYAEWNIFIDPLAAQKIFRSTLPITLVPLDACDYVLLDASYINSITAQDPVATFAKALLTNKSQGPGAEPIPVPIFDPLATLTATRDLKHLRRESFCLDVRIDETTVDDHAGQTIIVENDGTLRPITVVTSASQAEFETVYARIMNGDLAAKCEPGAQAVLASSAA